MPALQVRDLPDELYARIGYLARKEHRSLAQETVVLLKEGIELKLGNIERRKKLLAQVPLPDLDCRNFPDPATLIREDRNR